MCLSVLDYCNLVNRITTIMATRSQTNVYLLGNTVSELTGSKLPSLRMTLGLFFHYHEELKLTVRESSTATIRNVAVFWQKARIPMRDSQNCSTKLEKKFEEWQLLKKNKGRQSATQRDREEKFVSQLDDLFDVAHADALTMMTVEEDKEFLKAQREKGRRGVMAGVDAMLMAKEKRAAERGKLAAVRRRKNDEDLKRENAIAVLESSSSIPTSEEEDEAEHSEVVGRTFRKRGRKKIVTPSLAAALDRTKMSDRKATFVIAESLKSVVGHNMDDFVLNRSSIRRSRQQHRAEGASLVKEQFHVILGDVPLVVHWDGKLLQDLTGREKVDRLPVLVSGKEICRLLTVAKLPSGTGQAQAEAVCGTLVDWGIADNVRAMCFDSTSSNTGRSIGACVLLERKLGRELLSLACRHHVMELIIGAVFQVCMGFGTSGPEILLFKRFQARWEFIDTAKFKRGIETEEVLGFLQDVKLHILAFANKQLEDIQPRDDYREFLELVVIFLGGFPVRGVRFMAPGAMHHARWMSKVGEFLIILTLNVVLNN